MTYRPRRRRAEIPANGNIHGTANPNSYPKGVAARHKSPHASTSLSSILERRSFFPIPAVPAAETSYKRSLLVITTSGFSCCFSGPQTRYRWRRRNDSPCTWTVIVASAGGSENASAAADSHVLAQRLFNLHIPISTCTPCATLQFYICSVWDPRKAIRPM
ncbi:hypothetical protein V2G26_000531 [Clonostachys chloroleuca]